MNNYNEEYPEVEGFRIITVNKGEPTQCTLDFLSSDSHLDFEFRDFQMEFDDDPTNLTEDQVNENLHTLSLLKNYFRDCLTAVLDDVVKDYKTVKVRVSMDADYLTSAGNTLHNITTKTPMHTVYKHAGTRSGTIERILTTLFNPEDNLVQVEGAGSGLLHPVYLRKVYIYIFFPVQYNANSLSVSMRLKPGKLNRFLEYLPYNSDKYCLLHCILKNQLGEYPKERATVNKDKDYMKEFNKWMNNHNLERFYDENLFLIDKIPELEKELGISLIVHLYDDQTNLELYYRSNFIHNSEPMNIVIIPMSAFKNVRTNVETQYTPYIENNIDLENTNFLLGTQVKQKMNTVNGHAAILNTNFFLTNDNGKQQICKYCTTPTYSDKHEELCYNFHRESDESKRIKCYKEVTNPNLNFEKWHAQYRVPFCTFDWETRLVDNRHVPFSYSILYYNPFQPKKSKVFMRRCTKDGYNHKTLVEKFVRDCKTITMYHHDVIQSVDHGVPQRRETNNCSFCNDEFNHEDPNKRPEWNHSHFKKDNLNTQYNCWICGQCNKRAQLRNKPLKFYAHNGSRYDFNLFLPQFLNDKDVKNHEFLNKSESRFTQVVLGFSKSEEDLTYNKWGKEICKYKLSFNDSLLIVQGSLDSCTKAWIDLKRDRELLKALMKLWYAGVDDESLNTLVDQSARKAAFPYLALNDMELLDSTEPIERKHFADTFLNRDCTDEHYNAYLEANDTLKKAIDDDEYTFSEYHDYYLLLDVVLLAVILNNFMNLNHALNGVNPLAFLSTSSYTFNSFLKYNLKNDVEKIVIPKLDVQQFVKRSIKGGFTMIFNKRNLRGPNDYTFYVDFTSLYPTIMSLCKLPHKFDKWVDITAEDTVETILEKCSDDRYHFIECDIAPLDPKFQAKVQNYPMFPETTTIKATDYSENQQERWKINCNSNHFPDQTLNTVTFYKKKNYVTSLTYLKQAMEVGYKVTKIHRVASFHQEVVMKGYIDHIYKLKKDAKAAQGKLESSDPQHKVLGLQIVVYKVLLNALYGYTIVNTDNHKEAEMLDIKKESEAIHKRISDPRFLGMIQAGNKVVVNKMKTSYTLNYPLMLGAAILFESKLLTARFMYTLYDWLKDTDMTLHPCMMDTDSCVLSIGNFKKRWGSYDAFAFDFNTECYKLFDTTDSIKEYQMEDTHDALGFMTNETKGAEITHFVGLGPKNYSYKTAKKEAIASKGISKKLQQELLGYDLFETVVDGTIFEDLREDGKFREKYSTTYNDFKSAKFGIHTIPVTKQYITLADMKSHYPENGTEYAIFGSEKHLKRIQPQ